MWGLGGTGRLAETLDNRKNKLAEGNISQGAKSQNSLSGLRAKRVLESEPCEWIGRSMQRKKYLSFMEGGSRHTKMRKKKDWGGQAVFFHQQKVLNKLPSCLTIQADAFCLRTYDRHDIYYRRRFGFVTVRKI